MTWVAQWQRSDGRAFLTAVLAGCEAMSRMSRATNNAPTDIPVLIEHKPYSAARPIHNAIDCALDIRSRLGAGVPQAIGDITRITVRRHPNWAGYRLNPAPQSFHEAQVSLPYAVAAAFTFGRPLPGQFAAENLSRDDLRGLSAKVAVEPDVTSPAASPAP